MHLPAALVHVPRTLYQKLIMVMRLIAIFLFGAFMHASAAGFSQISLQEKDASLSKVLNLLSTQSGLKVVYEDELLAKSKPVTITLQNVSTEEALKQIFSSQPALTYEIIDGQVIAIKNNPGSEVSPQLNPRPVFTDEILQDEITGTVRNVSW